MATKTENLVIEHLRAIRGDIAKLDKKLSEHGQRLTSIEAGIASIKTDIAHHYSDIAQLHARSDGLLERIERIEQRLDIVGP